MQPFKILPDLGNHGCHCKKFTKIAYEETYSANEDEWTPDRIHSIQQKLTQWALDARTDHRSIPKRYWLITDQSNPSLTQALR